MLSTITTFLFSKLPDELLQHDIILEKFTFRYLQQQTNPIQLLSHKQKQLINRNRKTNYSTTIN